MPHTYGFIHMLRCSMALLVMLLAGCGVPDDGTTSTLATPTTEALPTTTSIAPTITPIQANAALYRGDLGRTGVFPAGGTPLSESPKILWTYEASDPIVRPPEIANDTAFVTLMTRPALDVVDLASGSKSGSHPLTAPSDASPVVANGVFYVAIEGNIQALDATTRGERWSVPIDGQPTTLMVVDDVLYVGTGEVAPGMENSGAIIALDADDGSERWRVAADNVIQAPLAFDDGTLYATTQRVEFGGGDMGLSQSTVRAIDSGTGKQQWEYSLANEEVFAPSTLTVPTVHDGRVFVASGYWADQGPGAVVALDAKTGAVAWIHTPSVELWDPQPLTVFGDTLFLATIAPSYPPRSGIEAPLIALDIDTGSERWISRYGKTLQAPAVSEGTLYLAIGNENGDSGTLATLDPATGKTTAELPLDFAPLFPPTLANGVVYLAGRDFEPARDVLVAIR